VQVSPKELSAVLEHIDQLIKHEKLEDALSALKAIDAKSNKTKAKIDVRIGKIYLSLSKPAKALEFFESANFKSMDDGEAYLGLAKSMLRLGRLVRARRHAQTALQTDPDLIDAHLVIAKVDDRGGQIDKARQRYGDLLKNQPENEKLIVAYAQFLADRDDINAATKLLERYVARHLMAAEAKDILGQLFWRMGKKDAAIRLRTDAAKAFKSKDNLYRVGVITAWITRVDPQSRQDWVETPKPLPQIEKREGKKEPPEKARRQKRKRPGIVLARPEPIRVPKGARLGQGSGFVINGGKHIITNNHVIAGAKSVIIRSGTGEVRKAKVVAASKKDDLAVLKLEAPYPENYALSYDSMGDPRPGRSAVVMGFPMAMLLGSVSPSLTEGIVSKMSSAGSESQTFQVTSKLNKGNSGGPVFDRRGNLIGVAVAKLDKTGYFEKKGYLPEDVNFAVKISRVFDLLQRNAPNGSQLATQDIDLEELYEAKLASVVLVITVLDAEKSEK
jgi:S1-C subfamily serine protease/thioredoxin-like negative regulator of GroEL